jgi:hypothetical protein
MTGNVRIYTRRTMFATKLAICPTKMILMFIENMGIGE